MKIFLTLFFLSLATAIQLDASPLQRVLPTEKKSTIKPKLEKPKFSWKRVFRPIRLFKRKIPFWLLWATLIGVAAWAIIGDTIENVDYILVGMVWVAFIALIVGILLYPIIFISRVIRELNWGKRYRKCDTF